MKKNKKNKSPAYEEDFSTLPFFQRYAHDPAFKVKEQKIYMPPSVGEKFTLAGQLKKTNLRSIL